MAQSDASDDSAPEFVGSLNSNSLDVAMLSSSNAKRRSAYEVADSDRSGDDENGEDGAALQGRMLRTMQNAELGVGPDGDDSDIDDGQSHPSLSMRNASGSSKILSLPASSPSSAFGTAFPRRRVPLELPDSIFAEAAAERASSKALTENFELLERKRAAEAAPKKKKRKVTHQSEDLITGSRIVRTLSNSSRAETNPATGSINELLKAANKAKKFKRKPDSNIASLAATKQSKGYTPAIGFSSFRR